MSGVIDDNGQQWERCNGCGEWVRYEGLRYERPSPEHKHGRDLCGYCMFGAKHTPALTRITQRLRAAARS